MRNASIKGTHPVWSSKPFLLLSTAALICLSVSRDLRFTVGLAIMWLLCYGITMHRTKGSDFAQSSSHDRACSCVAAFVLVVLSLNFYCALSIGKPYELLAAFGIPTVLVRPLIMLFTVIGCVVGFPALRIYARYMVVLFLPIVDVAQKMYKQYIALSAIYLCALLAIIRANFYYVDDLGRNVEGYSLTGSFSRYVSTYLATILHGNGWLTDISPLPQIFAALIMALAAIITLYVICERTEFRIMDIVCLVPFGLSPYFLECFSYKYDAPYMALSVLFAVFPLLLRNHSTLKYIVCVAIGTMLVCTTYQVSAGIFPLCVAFLCFVRWNQGEKLKDTLAFLCKSVAGYVAGVLFFRGILMQPFGDGDYVSSSINLRLVPTNLINYADHILRDFNLIWLVLFFIIFIGFSAAGFTSTKRKKVPAVLMITFAFCVMFALSYGLYSFFSLPPTSPRSMYGFGVFLSLLCWYIASNSTRLLSRAAVCLLAWLVFAFSFTYGNALHSQKEYGNFRTEQILTDLSKLDLVKDTTPKIFAISGGIGFSESVENMLPHYPVLADLIPTLPCDTQPFWAGYQLQHYYGIDHLTRDTVGIVKTKTDLTLLVDNYYHSISGNEDYILIELK